MDKNKILISMSTLHLIIYINCIVPYGVTFGILWIYEVSFHIMLSCCSVGTLPVSVTFSSARWDCACLSSCFLTLPDRVCPQRDSCARDRSGHGLSCFHRGQKAGSQILIHTCWCSIFSIWSSSCQMTFLSLILTEKIVWQKYLQQELIYITTCIHLLVFIASFNWNDSLM